MSCQYLFNVEASVDDFDLWMFPEELNADVAASLPATINFSMEPALCLEITDEEFIDQVNSGKRCNKSAIVSYDAKALDDDLSARITVSKIDEKKSVIVGYYKIDNLNLIFKQLMNSFLKKVNAIGETGKCSEDTPTCDVKKELAQLTNEDDCPCGVIFYTLGITCCGQSVPRKKSCTSKKAAECTSDSAADQNPLPQKPLQTCSKRDTTKQSLKSENYDEYSAQINGNELIVRVRKDDSSMLVTRVYENVSEKLSGDVNKFTLKGYGQKIDFQLPNCPESCPKESDEKITDHQIQTSLVGKFKNSCKLPVVRGNLKYPGMINDKSIRFDAFNEALRKVESSTEKFRLQDAPNRNVAMQVDQNRIKDELEGVNKSTKTKDGIEVCKRGSVGDCDVFIFKLGRKRIDKNGESSQIELEMRTPKGPDNGVKRMETRAAQVLENEFEAFDDRKKKLDETKTSKDSDKSDAKTKKKVGVKPTIAATKAKTVDTKKPLATKRK